MANLNFIQTIEVSEFKQLTGATSIKVYTNLQGKPYMSFFIGDTKYVHPVSQQSTLKEIELDPVVTVCKDGDEGTTIYMLHKRSDKAHLLQFEL